MCLGYSGHTTVSEFNNLLFIPNLENGQLVQTSEGLLGTR